MCAVNTHTHRTSLVSCLTDRQRTNNLLGNCLQSGAHLSSSYDLVRGFFFLWQKCAVCLISDGTLHIALWSTSTHDLLTDSQCGLKRAQLIHAMLDDGRGGTDRLNWISLLFSNRKFSILSFTTSRMCECDGVRREWEMSKRKLFSTIVVLANRLSITHHPCATFQWWHLVCFACTKYNVVANAVVSCVSVFRWQKCHTHTHTTSPKQDSENEISYFFCCFSFLFIVLTL